jgi:hypothetical protein
LAGLKVATKGWVTRAGGDCSYVVEKVEQVPEGQVVPEDPPVKM